MVNRILCHVPCLVTGMFSDGIFSDGTFRDGTFSDGTFSDWDVYCSDWDV